MRKCWNCGQPTPDNDLRVCSDPICQKAAISSRAKANEKIKASKDKAREYRQRPEVKERQREWQREYRQRPEVMERRREYARKYYQRPEVKKRMREYMRKRRQRLKRLREEE